MAGGPRWERWVQITVILCFDAGAAQWLARQLRLDRTSFGGQREIPL